MANEGLHCGPRKAGRGRQALIRVKPISANVNEKWLLVLGTMRAALGGAYEQLDSIVGSNRTMADQDFGRSQS